MLRPPSVAGRTLVSATLHLQFTAFEAPQTLHRPSLVALQHRSKTALSLGLKHLVFCDHTHAFQKTPLATIGGPPLLWRARARRDRHAGPDYMSLPCPVWREPSFDIVHFPRRSPQGPCPWHGAPAPTDVAGASSTPRNKALLFRGLGDECYGRNVQSTRFRDATYQIGLATSKTVDPRRGRSDGTLKGREFA